MELWCSALFDVPQSLAFRYLMTWLENLFVMLKSTLSKENVDIEQVNPTAKRLIYLLFRAVIPETDTSNIDHIMIQTYSSNTYFA